MKFPTSIFGNISNVCLKMLTIWILLAIGNVMADQTRVAQARGPEVVEAVVDEVLVFDIYLPKKQSIRIPTDLSVVVRFMFRTLRLWDAFLCAIDDFELYEIHLLYKA